MNKIVSKKRTSAIFLAIVLLTGTITLFSPSFMVGAQADSYYGQDNNYDKKSYGKNVSVKSIKCNNINVNVNGLELDVLPPALSTLLTNGEADDDAYSYGSGNGNYGSKSSGLDNDFKFICINNNNTVVVGEEPPIPPEPETCEECFTTNLNATEISRLLSATVLFSTLEQLCDFIDENFQNAIQRQFISSYLLNAALSAGIPTDKINDILDCLEEIYGVVFPRTIDRDRLLQARLTNSNSLGSSIAPNINTDTSAFDINTAGGLVASSFSSPSTITQGTEEDLSALEKIEKLKQQWIELLP